MGTEDQIKSAKQLIKKFIDKYMQDTEQDSSASEYLDALKGTDGVLSHIDDVDVTPLGDVTITDDVIDDVININATKRDDVTTLTNASKSNNKEEPR